MCLGSFTSLHGFYMNSLLGKDFYGWQGNSDKKSNKRHQN